MAATGRCLVTSNFASGTFPKDLSRRKGFKTYLWGTSGSEWFCWWWLSHGMYLDVAASGSTDNDNKCPPHLLLCPLLPPSPEGTRKGLAATSSNMRTVLFFLIFGNNHTHPGGCFSSSPFLSGLPIPN